MCEFDTLILFKERLRISKYDDFMQHLSIEKTRFFDFYIDLIFVVWKFS